MVVKSCDVQHWYRDGLPGTYAIMVHLKLLDLLFPGKMDTEKRPKNQNLHHIEKFNMYVMLKKSCLLSGYLFHCSLRT